MFETIKNFIDLILDKSKHWTLKLAASISILSLILIIDYNFKLSYNHFIESKLTNLEKIESLKKSFTSNPSKIKSLNKLENEIFYEKHYSELINKLFISSPKNIKVKPDKTEITKIKKLNTDLNIVKNEPDNRTYLSMFISTNLIWLIAILIMIALPFTDKQKFNLKTIINLYSTSLIITLMCFGFTWLTFKIPILFGMPFINYCLNFTLHILSIVGLSKLSDK